MTTTYTTSLRLPVMTAGDPVVKNAWGTIMATAMGLIDTAIAGLSTIALSGATYTLTTANNASDQDRAIMWKFTGTLSATCVVTIPSAPKLGLVINATTQTVTLTTGTGTPASIAAGASMLFSCDGTNVTPQFVQNFAYQAVCTQADTPLGVGFYGPYPVVNLQVWGPGGAGGDGGGYVGGGGSSGGYFAAPYQTSVGETLTLTAGAGQTSQGTLSSSSVVSNINGTLVVVSSGGQGVSGLPVSAGNNFAGTVPTINSVFTANSYVALAGGVGGDGIQLSNGYLTGAGAAGPTGRPGGAQQCRNSLANLNGWTGGVFGAAGSGAMGSGTGGSGGSGACILTYGL